MPGRWTRVLGALACSGIVVLGACGDDDTTTTDEPTATSPASTSTTEGTTTEGPPSTVEDALAVWAESQASTTYLGPCPTDFDESFPLDGFCSVELAMETERTIQGLGPPFSEIVAYVLLVEDDRGWSVSDDYVPAEPYDLSDAPDWLPESGPTG